MDSEHRHELKQNDLQEFIKDFAAFWDKHGMRIMVVVVIAAVVFMGTRLVREKAAADHAEAHAALAGTTSPAAFRDVANAHRSNPAVWAKANLYGADLFLKEATAPAPAESEDGAQTNTTSREDALRNAGEMYGAVATDAKAPLFQINGYLGLAAVSEAKADWDAAKLSYEKAIQLAGSDYALLKTQAEQRLELLPQLAEPIVFAPEPVVEEAAPEAAAENLGTTLEAVANEVAAEAAEEAAE